MSLKGRHIFIFSIMRFDDPLVSTNWTMARHLAEDNFVYYVDSPFTMRDYFINLRNTPMYKLRKPVFFKPENAALSTDLPNLKILVMPPVPSINFLPEGGAYRRLLTINESIVAKRINQFVARQGIKDYIFINSFNFYYPTLHRLLSPTLTVYHCIDPLIRAYEVKHGIVSEDIISKEADLIFCTSRELYRKKKQLNENTYFIPNAADISHSQKALDPELPVSPLLEGVEKPVVGYFGNIERRIDFPMLKEVFEQNPDKNFVFVGPMLKEYVPDWFFNVPNVQLKGAVPYSEMPAVVKGFDVGIIPFKKDEGSNKIFPLKLFEYMGAGKPVVATDFNTDLEEFTKGTVDYCATAAEFTAALNKALADTPEARETRIAIAAENTWEPRMKQMDDLLEDYFQDKLKAAKSR